MTQGYPRLVGDIGGTHARWGWQARPHEPITAVSVQPCADHADIAASARYYLQSQGLGQPSWAGLGVATPITGDQVRMTNHHWAFSISGLRQQLALPRLTVVNDFTALALSLPSLRPQDLRPLGGGRAVPGGPLALIGAGTGLGVSGLFTTADGRHHPVAGEGGHATLAAMDEEEADILALLRQSFGHVSAERALSGPGLVNLYQAAAQRAGCAPEPLSPDQVLARAREARDPHGLTAIDLFCRFLGSTAGNLALTLGASGGVYIGGGVAPRLWPELQASRFRERFEGKGRLRDYLAAIPCHLIDTEVSPALLGASSALDQGI